MTKKWVYLFEEGDKNMRDLLGGKGANLAEMTNIGLPIPPGFTVTTDACNAYFDAGKQFPEENFVFTETFMSLLRGYLNSKAGSEHKV